MPTRDFDLQPLTAAERAALRKLGVLKADWNPFGSHFLLGNTGLRLNDLRKATAVLANLLAAEIGRKPDQIGIEFDVTGEYLFDMKIQLPGGSSSGDRNFGEDELRALLQEYLDPKYFGIGNPSIEVVRDTVSGKFKGLMTHIPVVRGKAKTLDVATMLAVAGVKRVTVEDKTITQPALILARLDTRDPEAARAIVRALSDAIGLEVAGDIMLKDARPELALFDDDED